ncbi:MAG: hypothetical protein VR67_14670 [Peptococcaceae bacterium BRH_c8a]|nr:MAG: hypothetical protein VR67_14670 [Peptococcaceae bacterium BRH_c8a]
MLLIDHYAYSNKLSTVHPGEKFIFFVATVTICLALNSLATSLAVILLTGAAVILLARVPWQVYLKLMLLPASFLVVGVLTVAVTFTRNEGEFIWAVQLGSFTAGVTPGGLEFAGKMFLRSLGAVSCLYFLALTTPVTQMVGVLRWLRIPSLVIELMVLIYRFIFILLETAGHIYTAQSSRLGYRNVRTGFHSFSQLVLSLFVKSYRQSQTVYDALLARCYDGRLNFVEAKYRWSWVNIALIIAADGALTACWLIAGGV